MTRHVPAMDIVADDTTRLLTAELRRTFDNGRRPPCCGVDRDLWISDLATDRAEAAAACAGCPTTLWTACSTAAEANDERHGVWAGVDRARRTVQCIAKFPAAGTVQRVAQSRSRIDCEVTT